jgi:hypothetical protein
MAKKVGHLHTPKMKRRAAAARRRSRLIALGEIPGERPPVIEHVDRLSAPAKPRGDADRFALARDVVALLTLIVRSR